jgi:hypothetical protein
VCCVKRALQEFLHRFVPRFSYYKDRKLLSYSGFYLLSSSAGHDGISYASVDCCVGKQVIHTVRTPYIIIILFSSYIY